MPTSKKKSLRQLVIDTREKHGFNAKMGFWSGLVYLQYVKDSITYEKAIETLGKMSEFTGA